MTVLKADPARVRELAAQGLSQSTIAVHLGVSRERIRQICDRDGIETLSGKPDHDRREKLDAALKAGRHASEAARLAGYTSGAVYSALKAAGATAPKYRPPKPTVDKIRELAAQGLTIGETAARLGIAPSDVSRAKAVHGIVFQRDGRSK